MNRESPAVEDVGIDHGGDDIAMPQQLLDGPDIIANFQKMSGKGMAQGMAPSVFLNIGLAHSSFDCFLQDRFIQVMSASDSGAWICGNLRRRKNILPGPLFCGMFIFAYQGKRQLDRAIALFEILFMQNLYLLNVQFQIGNNRIGQHGQAIFISFAGTNTDLFGGKIDILDARRRHSMSRSPLP